MSHKMFSDIILICALSGQSDCCDFDDCRMFQKCYPDAYEDWQQTIQKEGEQANGED